MHAFDKVKDNTFYRVLGTIIFYRILLSFDVYKHMSSMKGLLGPAIDLIPKYSVKKNTKVGFLKANKIN